MDAIERGEDRVEFKKSMDALGIEMARSQVAYSVEEGLAIADELGYPVVLRPFTSLSAGIVKLAGLSDNNRTGTDN